MGRFSELAKEGIKNVWRDDYRSQDEYLKIIAESRQMDVLLLRMTDTFFVPNNEYLSNYFSGEIRDIVYDCYDYNGLCKWSNYLIIPIYNLADEIVAFCGFNPLLYAKAHEPGEGGQNYYQYSNKNIFQKGRYVYCPKGVQERAMVEQYVFVTDGVFDAISLVGAGFNAASLMGSNLTAEIIVQLKMMGNVFIVSDNDKAGLALQKRIKTAIPKAKAFTQGKTKDIDELLKSEYRSSVLAKLQKLKDGTAVV